MRTDSNVCGTNFGHPCPGVRQIERVGRRATFELFFSNAEQTNPYLAEQKTKTKQITTKKHKKTETKTHNGPSQITPSKGASEGLRLIHAVVLPRYRNLPLSRLYVCA